MRGVAGALEADGAGVGQRGDEMVGGVVAVERCSARRGRSGSGAGSARAGRARPGGPGWPRPSRSRRRRCGRIRGSPSRRARACSGATGWAKIAWPAAEREALEIVADRDGCAPRRPRAKGRGPIRRRSSPARSCRPRPRRRSAPAAGPASTCQRMVAPSDQPTPIAPSRSSASASSATSAAIRSTVGAAPLPPPTRRGRAGRRRSPGWSSASVVLRAEEAAMRHQPVQQHDRRAVARVAIGDSRPVRSGETRPKPLPKAVAPLFGVLRPGALNGLKLKPESIFKFRFGMWFLSPTRRRSGPIRASESFHAPQRFKEPARWPPTPIPPPTAGTSSAAGSSTVVLGVLTLGSLAGKAEATPGGAPVPAAKSGAPTSAGRSRPAAGGSSAEFGARRSGVESSRTTSSNVPSTATCWPSKKTSVKAPAAERTKATFSGLMATFPPPPLRITIKSGQSQVSRKSAMPSRLCLSLGCRRGRNRRPYVPRGDSRFWPLARAAVRA